MLRLSGRKFERIEMKTKTLVLLFFTFVFLLISCKPESTIETPVTQTSITSQSLTEIPTSTLLPTTPLSFIPTYPTPIPYLTASKINENAVAFIEQTDIGYSLWVVNVDGSGERKLADIEKNESRSSNYLLQWSPDGKWIGYISGNDLWIISPDGLDKKKIFLAT